ncbi:hypothetical protein GN157_00120 [Flavobacterium rakeshii]|uniref:Holin n=1 Tax=Flavobacterium rakeshii TaxID=1038845 RepID=A0A6N8H747_9FLAO|nr:hypothetical protein [Flavobacterium rakeshii]MUV02102.1 hypothetical protein [Flavobacterium rakeshii]
MEKIWIALSTIIAGVLSCYTDLNLALILFAIATTLDTATAIHAQATIKGLRFNPVKGYFWKEISSTGLRNWMKKMLWEYGIYLIMAFAIDQCVLKNMILFKVLGRELTLPVLAVYLFAFIEMWSIGENIERAGGINIFKRILSFIPEKYQKLLKP